MAAPEESETIVVQNGTLQGFNTWYELHIA